MELLFLTFLRTLIIAFVVTKQTSGYPTGPPKDSCIEMVPHHSRIDPRYDYGRFVIGADVSTYCPGDVITVQVWSPRGYKFKGIQLKAIRKYQNVEEQLGTFSDLHPSDKLQYLDCSGYPRSMVAHKNAEPVSNITVKWTISVNAGPFDFIATIVSQYDEFYYNIRSNTIVHDPESGPIEDPLRPAMPISAITDPIDWEECEHHKGCLLYPGYCDDDSCFVGVSFRVNTSATPNTVTFEVMAKVEGYVSLGFSGDRYMGGDETVSCTSYYDRVTIQSGYNHPDGKKHVRTHLRNLTDLEASYTDGKITCRFTRPIRTEIRVEDVRDPMVFDLNRHHYIFVAWGPLYRLTDAMNAHIEHPIISDDALSFDRHGTFRGSVMKHVVKAHAAMMSLAWMAIATFSVVMPKYYKAGFNGKKVFGVKIWFQAHRLTAAMTATLTIGGLICILVDNDGKVTQEDSAQEHMLLGFTVVALTCAQVLIGIGRPGVTGRPRPVFNVVHKLFGYSAIVLAAGAMFTAFRMDQFNSDMRQLGELAIMVWAAAYVFIGILMSGWTMVAPRFLFSIKQRRLSRQIQREAISPEAKVVPEIAKLSTEQDNTRPSNVIFVLFAVFVALSMTGALCIILFF